jgi:TRAP-type C4-dicarboxylate transport system permease small subunit
MMNTPHDEPADLARDANPADDLPPRVPVSLEGAIGAGLMALLCLITFANVVTRYLTNVSLAFTEEFSVTLMVILALVGAASAFAKGQHLRMGFAADKLAPVPRLWLEAVVLLLGMALFALIAWYGTRLTWDEFNFEVSSSGLGVPQWLYTMWLPVLCVAVCARIAGRIARVLRAAATLARAAGGASGSAAGDR